MFPFAKTSRLLKKSQFDFVFSQAEKVVTTEFIFLYRANDAGYPRLGLALSKKKIAKAHDRNRFKRVLRETFRLSQLPAIDIVVLARSGLAAKDHSTVFSKLGKAWNRLAVLCKK